MEAPTVIVFVESCVYGSVVIIPPPIVLITTTEVTVLDKLPGSIIDGYEDEQMPLDAETIVVNEPLEQSQKLALTLLIVLQVSLVSLHTTRDPDKHTGSATS